MVDLKSINISFVEDPDYKRIHATGVWGSVTPLGELQFDLVEDILPIPERAVLIPGPDPGQPAQERVPDDSEPRIVRRRLVGVTMPMSVVPSIVQWLQEKLAQHEANQKLLSEMGIGIPLWKEN